MLSKLAKIFQVAKGSHPNWNATQKVFYIPYNNFADTNKQSGIRKDNRVQEDDRDSLENADSINMERNVNVNQKGQDPKKQEKIVDDFGNLRKTGQSNLSGSSSTKEDPIQDAEAIRDSGTMESESSQNQFTDQQNPSQAGEQQSEGDLDSQLREKRERGHEEENRMREEQNQCRSDKKKTSHEAQHHKEARFKDVSREASNNDLNIDPRDPLKNLNMSQPGGGIDYGTSANVNFGFSDYNPGRDKTNPRYSQEEQDHKEELEQRLEQSRKHKGVRK